eukprot:CAMPEP_0198204816 /NCGR_PEP_ID=MMETSP1445-20131203/8285_1 /TAXON_ID=36898 /ORGANISM="Pyramimonas sp., Strain CCMP2087" /LENGTH=61 /DNA_ID=CAMNT_0043876875 /DNA_START=39 /DNA_END=224 /DNA_ORIENTATION=-
MAERITMVDELERMMRERFLAGKDAEFVDYSAIDNNERLDDRWVKEVQQDAEDAYFDDMDL